MGGYVLYYFFALSSRQATSIAYIKLLVAANK